MSDQLRDLTTLQRAIAEKVISEVIFYGKIQKLTVQTTINLNNTPVFDNYSSSNSVSLPQSSPNSFYFPSTRSSPINIISNKLIRNEIPSSSPSPDEIRQFRFPNITPPPYHTTSNHIPNIRTIVTPSPDEVTQLRLAYVTTPPQHTTSYKFNPTVRPNTTPSPEVSQFRTSNMPRPNATPSPEVAQFQRSHIPPHPNQFTSNSISIPTEDDEDNLQTEEYLKSPNFINTSKYSLEDYVIFKK